MLLLYALVLATDVHCLHHLGGHTKHLVGSHRQVETPAFPVIAVLVDLAFLALMIVLFVYRFVDYRYFFDHLVFFESFLFGTSVSCYHDSK